MIAAGGWSPDAVQALITGVCVSLATLLTAVALLVRSLRGAKAKNATSGKVQAVLMAAVKKATADMDLEQSLAVEDSISISAKEEGVEDEMNAMLAQAHDDGDI